jgi:hypothetical protein
MITLFSRPIPNDSKMVRLLLLSGGWKRMAACCCIATSLNGSVGDGQSPVDAFVVGVTEDTVAGVAGAGAGAVTGAVVAAGAATVAAAEVAPTSSIFTIGSGLVIGFSLDCNRGPCRLNSVCRWLMLLCMRPTLGVHRA